MSASATVQPVFDPAAAESFAGRAAEIVNAGALAVMMSIGHRSGLFDTLAAMPPATSTQIAERAALAERYVREWLAAMVVGGIVDYDPATSTYVLPPERAASLTRGAPLGNLAVYAQTIAMMGAVQDRILDRFETGGGMAYEHYPHFHTFMAEDSEQTVVAGLFDSILPLAPGLTERLEAGIDVLDAGCGRGGALRALARRFPASRFVGYDLCSNAVQYANAAASNAGLDNVCYAVRDLTGFNEIERYDLITSFDAIHDQRDPADLLHRFHRALRPGGTYLVQDIGGSARLENNHDFPMAALLYAISCVHCTPVSLGQGGQGLGTMWGWETAQAMLTDAGFERIERSVLPHDPMNVWFVCSKG